MSTEKKENQKIEITYQQQSQEAQDQTFMERAIELAKQGEGWTSPNPMVGAVIVKDGRIIGEGYHERCGELHAERNAIASLRESAEGATIYVTLEPLLPSGTDSTLYRSNSGTEIGRVVIGSRDPNPKVAGKGARLVREAGVIVEEDFMREVCDRLNPVFFHYITTKTPYVVLKYAMTADGKIATRTGASKWITGEAARQEVQHMRHRYTGIMVGIGTVLADDPMLNTRISGKRSPVRIICDSRLRIPLDSQIVKTAKEYLTIVAYVGECSNDEKTTKSRRCSETGKWMNDEICQKDLSEDLEDKREVYSDTDNEFQKKIQELEKQGVRVVKLPGKAGKVDLKKLMEYLGEQEIDSVLLEGGGALNESALKSGIVRHVSAFVAPKIFGGEEAKSPVRGLGVEVPDEAVKLKLQEVRKFDEDLLLEYEVENE